MKIVIRKDDEVIATITGTIQLRDHVDKFGNTIVEYNESRKIIAVVPPGYFVLALEEPKPKE
jgi:hypothetical protein